VKSLTSWRLAILVVVASVLLAGCDWAMLGFSASHTGFNPVETKIGLSNVAGLQEVWSAAPATAVGFPPAVVNGVVYLGGVGPATLYAFDAKGATNCSGLPKKTCAPLWTASAPGIGFDAPAVVNGVVYDATSNGTVFAFDAAGKVNCSGSPKTCSPLWTALVGGGVLDLVVANGTVYGTENNVLFALDANGNTNCSGTPKTCTPLWTASADAELLDPAVANGVVYTGSLDSNLYAFDAKGSIGCSGTPKTCVPLWAGTAGGGLEGTPAIAGGVVYALTESGTGALSLDAFDSTGNTDCSGSPKTCPPLWTAPIGSGSLFSSSPAIANGVVYVGSGDHKLYWFDASGVTGCSGIPKACTPLATATTGAEVSSPVVANGVVYVGSNDGNLYAFDAAHTANCSGTPTTCTALWTATGTGHVNSPIIANGTLYSGTFDGTLHAFALP
jgi:outer membrane protein assembly factor BamB